MGLGLRGKNRVNLLEKEKGNIGAKRGGNKTEAEGNTRYQFHQKTNLFGCITTCSRRGFLRGESFL